MSSSREIDRYGRVSHSTLTESVFCFAFDIVHGTAGFAEIRVRVAFQIGGSFGDGSNGCRLCCPLFLFISRAQLRLRDGFGEGTLRWMKVILDSTEDGTQLVQILLSIDQIRIDVVTALFDVF